MEEDWPAQVLAFWLDPAPRDLLKGLTNQDVTLSIMIL